MSGLRTRKPTGLINYPLILVEGGEKSGKSALSLKLSASPNVGRTFVAELGESTADEYAALGPFEILEHNGTFSDLLGQLKLATQEPVVDGKPNVIELDTGSALWALLGRWANSRARTTKSALKILADDPDAEVNVGHNLWNDATDRWYEVIDLFRSWPGIAIITTRGKEVSKFVDGKPVAGQTEWTVECQKSTPFEVNAVVRAGYPNKPRLMSVRKWDAPTLPRNGLELDGENPLEQVVFEILGAGQSFAVNRHTSGSLGIPTSEAKQRLTEIIKRRTADEDEIKAALKVIGESAGIIGYKELSDEQMQKALAAAAEWIANQVADPPESASES